MEKEKNKIIKFIQKQTNGKSVILGLSGGIDSALVAYLTVQAISKDKIYSLIMPSKTNSKEDLKHAQLIANLLEMEYEIVEINDIIESYQKKCDFILHKTVVGNLKARVRANILYSLANATKSLVIGTGNKSELLTGYFTKYGDGAVDLLPIGDLYKTQVFELAKYIGIPDKIIYKKPSAGLLPNQYDEDELKISYKKLDKILEALEKKKPVKKFTKKDVTMVQYYIDQSLHKRKLPPICNI